MNTDEMQLIRQIYPDIETNATNPDFMSERAILSGVNADVNNLNNLTSLRIKEPITLLY